MMIFTEYLLNLLPKYYFKKLNIILIKMDKKGKLHNNFKMKDKIFAINMLMITKEP